MCYGGECLSHNGNDILITCLLALSAVRIDECTSKTRTHTHMHITTRMHTHACVLTFFRGSAWHALANGINISLIYSITTGAETWQNPKLLGRGV